ncbi:MAG: hypothetical protein QXT27_06980 [Pyrobaculum sp.]
MWERAPYIALAERALKRLLRRNYYLLFTIAIGEEPLKTYYKTKRRWAVYHVR